MSSRRQYLTIPELEEFADITVTDNAEAYDQISMAEEMIDAYLGHQQKFISAEIAGKVTSSLTGIIVDNRENTPLFVTNNTYSHCYIEIIGGAGAGQSRYLIASSRDDRSVTFDGDAFNPALDATSVYRIYQMAKFPRRQDSRTVANDETFYKYIPEAIRRATAAQVQYMITMGADYFSGDDSEMDGERLLNYSYSRGNNAGQSALVKFMGPKARALLKGYKNSTGMLAVDHP